MRFERSRQHLLHDILHSIDAIADFIGTMDFADYVASDLVSSAVERKLLIISEAAVRLGKQIEHDCPTQDWRAIRGMGNSIRHHYEGVDHEIVWEAVQTQLPGLRTDVVALLASLEG